MMLKFSFRRLLRHWRLNLAVLLGLSLTSALLASLPSFAAITAMHSLRQSLADEHPAARNIQVDGIQLSAALYKFVVDDLNDLLKTRMVVRNTTLNVDPKEPIIPVDETYRVLPQHIIIWSFDKLSEYTRLLEGQWPEYYEPHTEEEKLRMMFQIEIDAVIDQETASQLNLKVGDRLLTNLPYEFFIVGIVERLDPKNEIWWGDPTPFEPTFRPGINEDTIFVPLLIQQRSMSEYLPSHLTTWRLLLDHEHITSENAREIEENLIRLKSHIQISHATMTSNLPNILLEYRENLTLMRTVLFLLSVQAFLFILYTLVLIVSLLLERSQGEMATLAGRGASSLQITRIFAIESLFMAVIAGGVMGPGLAFIALHAWAFLSREVIPIRLPAEAWVYSFIGAGFGCFALILTTYPAARHTVLEWQRRKARPDRFARWQKSYLDIFLFVFGIVAYWQLMNTRSFVLRQADGTIFTDPLLLLGPTLLLIAMAMLFLRVFPHLLSLVSRLARSGRGLVWTLGLARLARDPIQTSRVVLLISMAAGLAVFATSFEDSLNNSQSEMARYIAGADFRVKQLNHSLDSVVDIPGIKNITPVVRIPIASNEGKLTTILAVDSQTFSQVAAHYPQGMTYLTIDTVLTGLQWGNHIQSNATDPEDTETNPYIINTESDDKAITAMFSDSALESNKTVGDQQQVRITVGQATTFEIRGVIINFPTVSGAFIIVDRSALERVLNLDDSNFYDNHEIWLEVQPEYYAAIVDHPLIENEILADAQKELRTMQNNAFVQGSRRAFLLNAFILAVLSIVGFSLVSYFSARQRAYEFSILRAFGLSKGEVFRLLAGEGFSIMALGLIGGTVIGFALAHMMRPYLNLVLAKIMPSTVIYSIAIDWYSVALLYGILIGCYTLAMLTVFVGLLQTGIHRVMRIGEE